MWRPRVIPCLLLRGCGLVKGTRFRNHLYVGDPLNAVKIFNDKEVDELLFVDIAATARGSCPDVNIIQRIADECYMPFAIGGGIRSLADIRRLLAAGAEKVTLNTAAVDRPPFIREAADCFGSQSIVVAIDVCRTWRGRRVVVTHCGQRRTRLQALDWIRRAADLGAGEILLNAVERDGTALGYDLDLIREAAQAVEIPVIAGCGAGQPAHLAQAIAAGATAAAVGSLCVFHGPRRAVLINFPERDELRGLTASAPAAASAATGISASA